MQILWATQARSCKGNSLLWTKDWPVPCGLANSMQGEKMAVMQSYSISLLLDIYHQLEGDQPMVNCWWLTISRYLIMTKGVTVKVITPIQLNDLDNMALTQNYTIEGLRHLAHLVLHCLMSLFHPRLIHLLHCYVNVHQYTSIVASRFLWNTFMTSSFLVNVRSLQPLWLSAH